MVCSSSLEALNGVLQEQAENFRSLTVYPRLPTVTNGRPQPLLAHSLRFFDVLGRPRDT